MKLHDNLLVAVAESIAEVFSQNRYADKVIERKLKSNNKWGSRDRKFIAENSYNIIRKWRLLWEIADLPPSTEFEKLMKIISLELYLSGKDENFVKNYFSIPLFEIDKKYKSFQSNRAIRESVPDWLDELCYSQLGDTWDEELSALNQQANVVLRVNTIKISRDELAEKLMEDNITTSIVEDVPTALVLMDRQNIFTNKYFKEGFFEVQDASSQKVAMMMKLTPGLRIVDACAGGGGKSLHIATLMQNKGRVIALDTNFKKLDQLKQRARRNSISIIETKVIDSTKVIKRLSNSADRLLLDVPCSGLGVLRRNPDAKWKLSSEKIFELIEIQKNILQNYCNIVKPGGFLVYSTCSILPSENQTQIENFLQNNSNFFLEYSIIISPSRSGYDGFFICRLKRIN